MKKTIYLVLFLFCVLSKIHGQKLFKNTITYGVYTPDCSCFIGCDDDNAEIEIRDINGNIVYGNFHYSCGNNFGPFMTYKTFYFSTVNRVNSIWIWAEDYGTDTRIISNSYSENIWMFDGFRVHNDGDIDVSYFKSIPLISSNSSLTNIPPYLTINETIIPINPISNLVCETDNAVVVARSEYSSYKWYYKYQYGATQSTWTEISGQTSNVLNVNYSELTNIHSLPNFGFGGTSVYFQCVVDNAPLNVIPDGTTTVPVNFFRSTPTVISTISNPVSCNYNFDGSAQLTFSRGLNITEKIILTLFGQVDTTGNGTYVPYAVGNREYFYNTISAGNTVTWSGLAPGDYTIKVEGRDGTELLCDTNTYYFTINPVSPLDFSLSKTDYNCYQSHDGVINISASGGNGGYLYSLDGSTYQSSYTFNNVLLGSRAVTVKDSKGCFRQNPLQSTAQNAKSTTILQPDSLQLRVDAFRHPLGYGRQDGYVKVSALGGTTPYSFSWSNGFSGADNINLGDGKYRVTLTDAHGCVLQDSFQLIQPDPMVADIDTLKKILCHSDSNGSLVVHTVGGVKPYSFTWSTGHTDSIVHDLPTGTYTVTVVDINGNDTTATVYLGEPDTLNITEIIKHANCAEAADGAIDITPSGGVAPYTYEWVYGQHTQDISSLSAGNYYVSMRDSNQCRYDKSFVVPSPNALTTTINATSPTCYQGSDGFIDVVAKGGPTPYTYQWSPNGANQANLNKLSAGSYTSTVVDAQGCNFVNYAILLDPAQVQVNVPRDRYVLCLGQKLELDGLTLADPNVTYLWTSDKGYTSTNAFVTLEDSGKYTLTVKNPKGCTHSDIFEIQRSGETVTSNFLVTSVAYSDTTLLAVNVGTSYDRTVWHLPTGASAKVQNDSFLELRIPVIGEYTLGLTAYKGQCEETMEKRVKIVSRPNLINKDSVTHQTLIQLLEMYPNPNQGLFTVRAQLYEKADLQIRIINLLSNAIVYTSLQEGDDEYIVPIDIQQAASGVYVIIIETKKDKQVLRLIKNG